LGLLVSAPHRSHKKLAQINETFRLIFSYFQPAVSHIQRYIMIPTNESNVLDLSPELCPTDNLMKAEKAGRKRQRRIVSFKEEVKQRFTYSKEEVKECWYTKQDFRAMKSEIKDTIEIMKRHEPTDEVHYSQRGLEWYVKDAARARREFQIKAFLAVMERQAEGFGREDPSTMANGIAEAYAFETRSRKMAAYLGGIADERCARSASVKVVPTAVSICGADGGRPPLAVRRTTTTAA